MKVLKWLLVLVGVAALIGAIIYSYLGWLDLQRLVAAAESMRSTPQPNPQQEMVLALGLCLVSGLVLGLGLGLPRRTAGRIRKETLESSAAAREADIRRRAAGGGGETPATGQGDSPAPGPNDPTGQAGPTDGGKA